MFDRFIHQDFWVNFSNFPPNFVILILKFFLYFGEFFIQFWKREIIHNSKKSHSRACHNFFFRFIFFPPLQLTLLQALHEKM